jgi:L-lactate dehydrogenase complex protein LldF
MNGRCQEVCPVAIPLPTLLRGWRDRSWREGLEPASVRAGLAWWAYLARHPRLYRMATSAAVRSMRLFRHGGWIRSLPMAKAWTAERDFPAPPGRTFMELYRESRKGKGP